MTSFGQHYVVPMISQYQQKHSSVQVDLTLAQRVPNLLDEGYDVSIVLANDLPDSGLVSARLGSIFQYRVRALAYIEKNGAPHVLLDLVRHTCLHLMTPSFVLDRWGVRRPERAGNREPQAVGVHGECCGCDGRRHS